MMIDRLNSHMKRLLYLPQALRVCRNNPLHHYSLIKMTQLNDNFFPPSFRFSSLRRLINWLEQIQMTLSYSSHRVGYNHQWLRPAVPLVVFFFVCFVFLIPHFESRIQHSLRNLLKIHGGLIFNELVIPNRNICAWANLSAWRIPTVSSVLFKKKKS